MKLITRYEKLVGSFVITISMLMVMYSLSFFATPKKSYSPLFLQNAKVPPCVANIEDLPISLITATHTDNKVFRGTAFMVDPNIWITAAHVVEGDIADLSIMLRSGPISGVIEYIGDINNDIAIIITEPVDEYIPLVISEDDPAFFERMWNIGYPGWAGTQQVVTSGHLIDLYDDKVVATSAMVMGGMSGGPTVHCNGDELQVDGVIKSYKKQLTSEQVVIVDGVQTVEKSYINTGEGYSTSLHRSF